MGFDQGSVILNKNRGPYYTGETIVGKLIFNQEKTSSIRGIYVNFRGSCQVRWSTTVERQEHNRTVSETTVYQSHEEYFNIRHFLVGGANGEIQLPAGHYEYNFDCPIQKFCPSSFEGRYGHVRYRLEVVMVIPGIFSFNKSKKFDIKIEAPLDLNLIELCKVPLEYEMLDSYCCWCVSAGSSQIVVRVSRAGFCPGESIPIDVNATNHSSVHIKQICFAIRKETTFESTFNYGTKVLHDTIAETKIGPLPAGTTRQWNLSLVVPPMKVDNMDFCTFIDVKYYLRVSTSVRGCHRGTEDSHRIVIGTIPLSDHQPIPTVVEDRTAEDLIDDFVDIRKADRYPGLPYPPIIPSCPTVTPYSSEKESNAISDPPPSYQSLDSLVGNAAAIASTSLALLSHGPNTFSPNHASYNTFAAPDKCE